MARLDFSQYNYDALVKQLRSILKTKDSWKDLDVESGTGNLLIELFSFVTEMMMYYLERRAQESYIDTAQNRSSVVRLVSLLNYRPKRKTSSEGNLKFRILSGSIYAYDIYLPKGLVVKTAANIVFIVKKSAVLRAGQINIDLVEGIQGQLRTQS